MGLFCNITNVARAATEAVEKAHDSPGGKWMMMGTVAAAAITGLCGIVGQHVAARDRLKELELLRGQQHFINHQFGSNYVARVEAKEAAK